VQLEARQTYQIDLMSNDFDAFLYPSTIQGRAAEMMTAAMAQQSNCLPATRTGVHFIEATSLSGHANGNFTFIVRKL